MPSSGCRSSRSANIYFNTFSQGLEAEDLSATPELESLLVSAADWGVTPPPNVRYLSRNLVVNGLRLHVLEWGQPDLPPLLIVHGHGQSAHSWDLVSLALSSRFHVFAIDQRGHGDSEWPRDADMSAEALKADLRAVFAALNLDRPVVIAHSMGGRLSLALLLEEDLASRFVCVDIGPELTFRGGGNRIGEFMRASQEFESVDAYVEQVLSFEPSRTREQVLRTMPYNVLERADGKLVRKAFRRIAGGTMPIDVPLADLAQIACPVLVVRGEDSDILSPEAAERFAGALTQGRLVTVPRCGHNVHTQNTAGFLDAIDAFIDGRAD